MSDIIIRKVKGKALVRKPNNEHDFWRIDQLYFGEEVDNPKGVRVPNVGDIVIDSSQGSPRWLEVQFVDDLTLIPELVELVSPIKNEFGIENRMLGVGPGYQSELFRLYLDQSVIPHVFIPDSRLHIYGHENTKYKIFKGTDTSAVSGKVISMDFNNNGELIGDDIALEKVLFPNTDEVDINLAVKACRRGYTTTALQNGDIVTLVTYTESGVPSSYNTLLVHNTALDRRVEQSTKYIVTVGIESPFLDKTENNTLIFPSNIPRDALAIMGVITYSDGSTKRIPVSFEESGRLRLLGLDNYIAMKKDQNFNLTLVYYPPDGEMALNASMGEERFIAVKYFGRTLNVDGSYSVNIFPIPTYISRDYGWQMRYLLYTLDRDMVYDVTNVVEAGANTKPFEPLTFNLTQDITVALDLSKVDPRLKKFRHVQTFKIALMGHARAGMETGWLITYEKDQDPIYGSNIICRAVRDPGLGRWRLDLSCGAKNLDQWLERTYYRILPLTDKYTEKRAPKPTHFTIVINDKEMSYPIQAWNQILGSEVGAHDGYGVIVQWTRLDGNEQYQLGASPFMFVDISEGGVLDHAGNTIVAPDTSGQISTIIDIDEEVKRIADRGASQPVQDKYRELLEKIVRFGLLKYEDINAIYQRIRNDDLTAAQIANDVILLEMEINKISISDFNRETLTSGRYPIPSMERQR